MRRYFILAALVLAFGATSVFSQPTLANVFTFQSTNGSQPYAAMTVGADGNFYGAAAEGGTNYGGVIFELTSNNNFSVLAEFAGTNGSFVPNAMTKATNGNLYGVTYVGGTNGTGSIFEFTTNKQLIPLVSLNGTNGANPWASLTQASDGNFYGSTSTGGVGFSNGFGGNGVLFMVTTNGIYTNIYNFTNGVDGATPYGAMVEGTNHVLYGTTYYGGSGGGTIFGWRIDPGFEVEMALGGDLGSNPGIGFVTDCNGKLLTATSTGGLYGGGALVEYDYTKNVAVDLHDFGLGTDGATPYGAIAVKGRDYFGTTYAGGKYGFGMAYKYSFDLKGIGTYTEFYHFHDTFDGGYPKAGPSVSSFGIYFTTLESNPGYGTIEQYVYPPRLRKVSYVNQTLSTTADDTMPGYRYQPYYSWNPQGPWSPWGSPITANGDSISISGPATEDRGFVDLEVLSQFQTSR